MVVIINYGLGNIKAIANVYHKLNIPFTIAQNKEELVGASKIILPGVGSFDYAMQKLKQSGMLDEIEHLVLVKKTPVLGICLGMQILSASSEEGVLPGLGWIQGVVKKFDVSKIHQSTKLPHLGWNDVTPQKINPLFIGLESEAIFYFLHSFYFSCSNKENSLAVANYGGEFTCSVHKDNIYGVQFHPEKSHKYGIQLLKNFANL